MSLKAVTNEKKIYNEYKEDDTERYNHPFHKLYDGTQVPYGNIYEDGVYHIHYNTTSRYGYSMKPIFGVPIHKATEDIPCYIDYRIFIGECPHKDENGNWVTYNEVPNFFVGAFAGAQYIDKEPDVPHIIRIITDEFDNELKERNNKIEKETNKNTWELSQKITYCSLKTYLQGLHNRLIKRFGKFSKYIGERSNLYEYRLQNDKHFFRVVWCVEKETDSKHIWVETEDWWRFLHFKKDGKFCLKYEKRENEHCYCSC